MFGRKKNKDADWMSGAQVVPSGLPAPDATSVPPAAAGAQPVTTTIGGIRIVTPPGVQIMQPTPEQIKQATDMAERFMGRDLNGDGQVAGAAPAPATASGEAGVVDQLERLAKLRDSGVLTDAEFAAEKAKILKP